MVRPRNGKLDPTMTNPWNAEVLRKFHKTVEALYATRQNPLGNVAYRHDYRLNDETAGPYTMRFFDTNFSSPTRCVPRPCAGGSSRSLGCLRQGAVGRVTAPAS